MIAKWWSGAITDSDLAKSLEESESLNDKEETFLIKGLMLLGIGEKEEALKIFKKVFADEVEEGEVKKDDINEFWNVVRPIFHSIQLEWDNYFQNKSFST